MASHPTRPAAPPDRLFVRATWIGFGAAIAVILGGHAVLDRAQRAQSAAAELAMAAASETAAGRSVAGALERLVAAPGNEAALKRLVWETDRLTALDTRRLALTPGLAVEGTGPLAAAAAAARAKPSGPAAEALLAQFETRLLPQLDRIADRARTAAEAAHLDARRVLVGSLAFQLAACALLLLAVIRPARRRIEAWLADSAEAERENRFRLLHDPLTGLPNAAYFQAHLRQVAAGAGRGDGQTALLRVDLDRFEVMRETLGQRTCDEVLRLAARRVRKMLRAGDFAAYLGQDDFVVVATDLDEANDAAMIASRLQTALGKPFAINAGVRRISASVGVTLLSDDSPDAERIAANAEMALAAARAAGPGSVRYFRDDLRHEAERREALFTDLVLGLDRGEVLPYFQPQLDLATGAFGGFEALVRWRHPTKGLLEPESFLDFAERTDLSERIGELVLTRSLEALRVWDAAGLEVPRIGVNFAAGQLGDPRLVEKIKWETERLDIAPERIAIEVLETILIKSDTDMVVRNLRGLASAGFHVELDDFGTGHASIANLRRFMVNRIKIDRSFVTGIEDDEEQRTLTASMIAMAHALGIATLAEGVETEAASTTLAALGCDAVQGYHVGRPMSLDDSLEWLAGFRDERTAR